MATTHDEIWITDLAECAEGPVADQNRKGCWRSIPYRVHVPQRDEDLSGVSLAANAQTAPSPIVLRLGVEGTYRVFFLTKYPIVGNFTLRVRLSGEPCSETLTVKLNRDGNEYPEWWDAVEIYWKDAALGGNDIVLAPLGETWLWAIRLVPAESARSRPEVAVPYVFTDDGDMMWTERHTRKEDILEREVLIGDDTCAGICVYSGINFDVCNYQTRVGTIAGSSGQHPTNASTANLVHNMRFYSDSGLDPFALVRDYVKERGWEFHVYVRLRPVSGVYPLDGVLDSKYFLDHPEFHLLDKQGTHVCGLSYAYPQVREHLLALYREILGYGVDGLVLCFVRGSPLVLYEPIMVDGFQKKYGVDPRKLEDTDDRWLDFCAEINTDFMREVKSLAGPGQRISGLIHGTPELNRRWAIDVPRWVREGLIDDCYIIGHIYDEHDFHWDAGPEQIDYPWFQNLPGRERVRLFPMLYDWDCLERDPQGYQNAFWSWIDAGADGYGIWDGNGHMAYEYRYLWRTGFRKRLPYAPESRLKNRYPIREINRFRHDRYSVLESW